MGFDVAFQGAVVTILVMISYLVGHRIESGVWEFVNSADGTTMAFLTLSMVEICHSLNMRSRRGSIFKLNSHNVFLYGAMLVSLDPDNRGYRGSVYCESIPVYTDRLYRIPDRSWACSPDHPDHGNRKSHPA